jgi:hypothetical protein
MKTFRIFISDAAFRGLLHRYIFYLIYLIDKVRHASPFSDCCACVSQNLFPNMSFDYCSAESDYEL